MKKIIVLSMVLTSLVLFTDCNKDDDDSGDSGSTTVECSSSTTPTYTGAIKALLDTNCATANCHDTDTAANGLDLSTYATASAASTAPAFLGSIQHQDGFEAMPRGADQLSAAAIEDVICWVEGGSPE